MGQIVVLGTGYTVVSKIDKVLALLEEGEKQRSTKKYVLRNSERCYKGRVQTGVR